MPREGGSALGTVIGVAMPWGQRQEGWQCPEDSDKEVAVPREGDSALRVVMGVAVSWGQ